MIEIRANKNISKQNHHEFEYKNGKKILKEDNGIRFAYIDKYGLFHVTKWEDEASEFGDGIYAVTDQMECKDGLPLINGKTYKVWGADDCSVKLSSKGKSRFYVNNDINNKNVIISRKNQNEKEAYNLIREIYIMIELNANEKIAE